MGEEEIGNSRKFKVQRDKVDEEKWPGWRARGVGVKIQPVRPPPSSAREDIFSRGEKREISHTSSKNSPLATSTHSFYVSMS